MYDWRCQSCNTKYEAMAKMSELTGTCPVCGKESKRLISAPTIDPRLGVDPEGFGTMGDKWAKKMENRYKEVQRRKLEHGDEL